jgi:hypothetical protein
MSLVDGCNDLIWGRRGFSSKDLQADAMSRSCMRNRRLPSAR